MTTSFDTPILLILFNRPERIREVIDALRPIRPSRILAVADGPRDNHPGDRSACLRARAELERIDWPCTIERDFAPMNLGCSPRCVSGIDWAFSRVEHAIVLEDDVVPDPSFFPWVAAMLDRFGDDPKVTMISGRNHLGRWGQGHTDHVRARWFSVWGWAGTAQAWRRTNAVVLEGDPARAHDDVAQAGVDPLFLRYQGLMLEAYRTGELTSWDIIYGLRTFLLGGAGILPPVNLTKNTGIGPEATKTMFEDDFSALIPVGAAPAPLESGPSVFDDSFDRAALLIELMSRCADPPMALRLAKRLGRIPLEERIQLHLAPFAVPDESLGLLEDLAAQGVSSPHFDFLLRTLRGAAPAVAGAS